MTSAVQGLRHRFATPMHFTALLLLLASALLGGCAHARVQQPAAAPQPSSDYFPHEGMVLEGKLHSLLSHHAFARTWFRLEEPGSPPVELAFGGASPGSLVSLGSVSKSVTGIAILLLVQQGKIQLDTKLKDVLAQYFIRHGSRLDPSLNDVTIERLVTHRAGLRGNLIADPIHGLASAAVTSHVRESHPFFDYLLIAGENKSDNSRKFTYSNLSYLLLGMVIEAVSEQSYVDFCRQAILRPLGITDAVIPENWTIVGPFGGWQMSLADVLKIREVFDVYRPSLLTPATLHRTLLARLGGPIDKSGHVYYTISTWIRINQLEGSYTMYHDGISYYYFGETPQFMFTESTVPGYAWAVAIVPAPPMAERRAILNEIRSLLHEVLG